MGFSDYDRHIHSASITRVLNVNDSVELFYRKLIGAVVSDAVLLVMGPLFLVFIAAGDATNTADFVRRAVYLVSFGVIGAFLVMDAAVMLSAPSRALAQHRADILGREGYARAVRRRGGGRRHVWAHRIVLTGEAALVAAMLGRMGWVDWFGSGPHRAVRRPG